MTYSRTLVLDPEHAHSGRITCLSFSPLATYLATGDEAGTILIWDVRSGEKIEALSEPKDESVSSTEVSVLLWAPFSVRGLFIGRVNGRGAMLPDVLAENNWVSIHTGTRRRIGSMDVDAVTRLLAVTVGPEIHVSRAMGHNGDYVPVQVLPAPRSPPDCALQLAVRPRAVRLNRGATMLFATYLEHGVVCWDVAQETTLWHIFPDHPVIAQSALFNDMRTIFIALENGAAQIYRVGEHRPRLTVKYQDDGPVHPPDTAILLNGSAIAVGSEDKSIRIWNLQGELLQEVLPDGAQDRFSGRIAGRDTRRVGYLACVVEGLGAANSRSPGRITIYSAPIDFNLWRIATEFVFEAYGFYIQSTVESVLKMMRRRMLLLLSLTALAVSLSILRLPAIWEPLIPAITAWILAISSYLHQAAAQVVGWSIDLAQIVAEASVSAGRCMSSTVSAAKQSGLIALHGWVRGLADRLDEYIPKGRG